jgi:hypothetical protein
VLSAPVTGIRVPDGRFGSFDEPYRIVDFELVPSVDTAKILASIAGRGVRDSCERGAFERHQDHLLIVADNALCCQTSRTVSIMFKRTPIRSVIGIRRAWPGSSVRIYRPNLSTVHSDLCKTDLTAIPTKTRPNRRISRAKNLEKG